MKKNVLYLLILGLIGLNIGTWLHYYSYRKKAILVIDALHKDCNNTRSIEKIMKVSIDNSNIQLKDVFVRDSSNTSIPLKNYFRKNKYLLVNRFSESHCESCVSHSIRMINNKISSLKKENILFLGDYRNNKIFNRLKVSYGIDTLNIGNVKNIDIPAEKLGYPYYFVIDSALSVQHLFVPDKGSPAIDERYLYYIQEKFFNK